MFQLNLLEFSYWKYYIIQKLEYYMHLNILLQKYLSSFFSKVNGSCSLFILGREVDQEVELVQAYFYRKMCFQNVLY